MQFAYHSNRCIWIGPLGEQELITMLNRWKADGNELSTGEKEETRLLTPFALKPF